MRWVGTSFKMTKNRAESVVFAARLRDAVGPEGIPGVQPFVLPSATALGEVAAALGPDSPVLAGAQNAHWEDAGAWTGEISVPQAADAGARIVEIGHSERREHFAETDATVRLKVTATLRHGLVPLVCCGEDAEVFARGRSVGHVLAQVSAALDGLSDTSAVLVAYEPIWAIGEHGREARPEDIADVHAALRADYGSRLAGILYGGSVNQANAAGLLEVPGVDGVFVGRAAWRIEDFLSLIDIARKTPAP